MQLYALNQEGKPVFANLANKRVNYTCLECQSIVRLRAGLHRQPHFYHIQPNRTCHLSGKSLIHLQVQLHILQHLPLHECQLEYRFPTIGRIADVAWIPQNLIFEIQCSSISAEEVLKRNHDYEKQGWQVIWILHDQRYNQWRFTAMEWALRFSPHYFTNIDEQGKGIIYDQFDRFEKGKRQDKMDPLPINVVNFRHLSFNRTQVACVCVRQRLLKGWKISFEGDLIDLSLREGVLEEEHQSYLEAIRKKEQVLAEFQEIKWTGWFKRFCYHAILRPYRLLFQMLLERVCR